MKFFVRRWHGQIVTLDLDLEYATIAKVKTAIIDQYKASLIANGYRVLRSHCLPSAITLTYNDRELEAGETLVECGIAENSMIETIYAGDKVTRKRYGKGFDDDITQELILRREKQQKKGEQKRKATEEMAGLLQWDAEMGAMEAEMEAEIRPYREQLAGMEEEGRYGEDKGVHDGNQEILEEPSTAWNVLIRSDVDDNDLVDFEMVDPYIDEDGNKENWDPQFLRIVGDGALARR